MEQIIKKHKKYHLIRNLIYIIIFSVIATIIGLKYNTFFAGFFSMSVFCVILILDTIFTIKRISKKIENLQN